MCAQWRKIILRLQVINNSVIDEVNWLIALRPIHITLDTELRSICAAIRPAPEKVDALINNGLFFYGVKRGNKRKMAAELFSVGAVGIALHGKFIAPVRAEPGAETLPFIIGVATHRVVGGITLKSFGINPICSGIAKRSTLANIQGALLFVAVERTDYSALGIARVFGANIDHAIHRVCAPECAPRTTNHFNPLNILQHQIMGFPEDTAKHRVIDRPAINQHQQFVCKNRIETSNADGPAVGVHARDLHTGNHSQRIGDGGNARALDVFTGDDINRSGGSGDGFCLFGHAEHFSTQKLFGGEVEVIDVGESGLAKKKHAPCGDQTGVL